MMTSRPRGSAHAGPLSRGAIAPLFAWRIGAFVGLAACEAALGSLFYEFPIVYTDWPTPVNYANWVAQIFILASLAFPLVAWRRRTELVDLWRAACERKSLGASVVINLGVFALLMITRYSLATVDTRTIEPVWYWVYCGLLLGLGATVALVAAPWPFWRDLARGAPVELLLSLVAAGMVLLVGEGARQGWQGLSLATLLLSHGILSLYEGTVFLDVHSQILGAEAFRVQIGAPCSGYEGIGLVVTFLSIFLWVFRDHLRFPLALCLIPIGIGAIWLLNSLRIALLVSIGAHVSPEVALDGFHSMAGWITFLMVTGGIMAGTRLNRLIWITTKPRTRNLEVWNESETILHLMPFAALMAATIVSSAFAPHDHALYPLKVVAIGAALWWFRGAYARFLAPVSLTAIAAGLAVGVAWIATDPQRGLESPVGTWLAELPLWLAVGWFMIRALGSVILVPIAEELTFRGYLLHALMSFQSARITAGQMRWIALVASSLAFGVLHEHWVAATVAGAVYAALMLRSGRLSDAIAAHMASNGVIILWSVVAQQWTLL